MLSRDEIGDVPVGEDFGTELLPVKWDDTDLISLWAPQSGAFIKKYKMPMFEDIMQYSVMSHDGNFEHEPKSRPKVDNGGGVLASVARDKLPR